MGLGEAPGSWKAAAAMAVLTLLALGWAEARMGVVARAEVAPVAAEVATHKGIDDEATRNIKEMVQELRSDARATREKVDAIYADCRSRGGCR
jgi:hypothetical protein